MSDDSQSFSFPKQEEEILAFWQKKQIFEQSQQKTAKAKPYIFYDGPPFATGLPHYGHMLASTVKDIVPRYQTMLGRNVVRRFGWDCHGLPIEYEIDKKLGMSAHDAVKELGIAGYNNECRQIVQRYTKEWRATISRLGRWVDFDNDYKTMDLTFMESVWWVFKQLWDKDLIYQGVKVVPFSTALGTGLSNFEASSNYQEVQDPALTVLFKLTSEEAYLAAWTTTPWTLPSNLALAVGVDIEYTKVRDQETKQVLILASSRLAAYQDKHPLEILGTMPGKDLVGKHYEPLFPTFADQAEAGAFQVIAAEFVTTTDGTGIVHCAPAFGEDDAQALIANNITAFVAPVDDHGRFTLEVDFLAGLTLKEANPVIQKLLKQSKQLYQHDTIVHNYPFCPRSDTPLIYKAIPSWYVKVESFKEALLKNNQAIHWVPSHIQAGRFGKWLENAKDWAISRNRIWGTPLPIWVNDETGNHHCIGSIDELQTLTGQAVTDLHREHVDELSFTKEGEPGVYRRIPEVLDCWFESGAMPYAQLHYPFENETLFNKGFPAEFIAEGLDQTRGWFYTLNVLSTALHNQPAFTNVIVNGIITAEDGKKMSKRFQNYTDPGELIDEHGADALRLYLISSGLVKGEEQRFSDKGVKEMVRRLLLPWHNAFTFLMTYAKVDQWDPQQHQHQSDHLLDQWILSRLESTKQQITTHMQAYHLYQVLPVLLNFIEDLTNGYIRLNRPRFWTDQLDDDKRGAYSTLYRVISELTLIMAPFTPFLAEAIYQALKNQWPQSEMLESVHLCAYPSASKKNINKKLEQAVDTMLQVIILGRQKRNDEKIKVKTPLSAITIIHKDKKQLNEIKKLEDIIARELNIKQVHYDTHEGDYIDLYAKPNSPRLGKRFGKQFKIIKDHIENLSPNELNALESLGKITVAEHHFTDEDVLVFRQSKRPNEVITNRFITIQLNCTLTPELIEEGLAREVVNRIQKTRKDLDLHVADRIHVYYQASPELEQAINKHRSTIQKETLTVSLHNQAKQGVLENKHMIEDYELTLMIEKT